MSDNNQRDEAQQPGGGPGAQSDAMPPPGTPEATIKALEAELADMKDRLLRAVAETENVRKRGERERADEKKYAITKFARDMVTVADNLGRALRAVTPEQLAEAGVKLLADGVELTERELLAALERNGVKRIIPKGEPFNANYHQAVAEIPVPGAANGTIVEVIEAGYVLGERLIRPAMVVVAKGTAPSSADAGASVDTKV